MRDKMIIGRSMMDGCNKLARISVGWVFLTVLPFTAAAMTSVVDVEGVRFQRRIRVQDVPLELNAASLLRYRILIKAYVAGLYLGEGVSPQQVLDDVPKRLEIQYFWSIGAEDIVEAGTRGIEANVDEADLAGLRDRIDVMNRLYEDVAPGDRYALTYLPGVGTELSLNGSAKGVVVGADFAKAIFSIWLGETPLDESLKRRLLSMSW